MKLELYWILKKEIYINSKNFDIDNLEQIQTEIKSGKETLIINGKKLPFKLIDFWKWSTSDLVSNATRGVFAEFIVATAANVELSRPRVEWDAYDLITPEGIKIEVKSAAYVQTWHQKTYSKISFSIRDSQSWDHNVGKFNDLAKKNSDICVMCLLKTKNQVKINPLDIEQWEFYVVPTAELDKYFPKQSTIALSTLKKVANPVTYQELKNEIKTKAGELCI